MNVSTAGYSLAAACRTENVYVTSESRCGSARLVLNSPGIAEYNANNLQIGGSVSFQVPAMQLQKMVVLNAECTFAPGVQAPQGWLFQCIRSVEVSYGSSSRYVYDGTSNFVRAMLERPTYVSRDRILKAAGSYISGAQVAAITDFASIPIHLPSSSIKVDDDNAFPVDLSLMDGVAINLTIYLRQPSEIFWSATGAGLPVNFNYCAIALRNLVFADRSQSIREQLISNPQALDSTFWTAMQSFTPPPFVGSADPANPCQVSLSAFRAGALSNIVLVLQKVADISSAGNALKNVWCLWEPQNVELLVNGTPVQRLRGRSSVLYSAQSYLDGTSFPSQRYAVAGGATTASSYEANVVDMQLTQFSNLVGDRSVFSQAAADMTNMVLTLKFTTPDSDTYRLTAIYCYEGALVINSTANILF